MASFRVGQRVRLLHDSGEGVITALIDKNHVEVDMGDDFPMDMHVDEIIPVDRTESKYLGETPKEEVVQTAQKLGPAILEVSLVVTPEGESSYNLHLINPEPVEMLFVCYLKAAKKYHGLAKGILPHAGMHLLGTLEEREVGKIQGFYVQLISFKAGQGHPHAPFIRDFPWRKNQLNSPSRYLPSLDRRGWVFSLREDPQEIDVKAIPEHEIIRVKKAEKPKVKPILEVDLHIEKLVKNPHELSATEMLNIQLKKVEQTLAEALEMEAEKIIFIHGIGVGTLKKAVHEKLKNDPHVKDYTQASPARYGNGATEATLQ
ncbi:MAG: Smr/MutS family protein [Bacteroidota bacterium]